jgi:hypothetical protein
MAAKEIKIKVEVGDTETVWGKWEEGILTVLGPLQKCNLTQQLGGVHLC